MPVRKANLTIFLVLGLVCAGGVVALSWRLVRAPEPETMRALIKALLLDARLRLSDRAYAKIEADIRGTNDLRLLEACPLAIEISSAELPDADTSNRVSNTWDLCVGRLADTRTAEAARVLVRMLERTDGGGTLSVVTALTEIGRPALLPLREVKDTKARVRDEVCEAIEQGKVLGL